MTSHGGASYEVFMKNKFCIENYSGSFVMHCPTMEAAKIFTKHLHSINKVWCNGESYEDNTCYRNYTYETCYNFNSGAYGNISTYIDMGYTILEFDDFYWDEYNDYFEIPEEEIAIIDTFLNTFKNS